jgi:hypothetical protein
MKSTFGKLFAHPKFGKAFSKAYPKEYKMFKTYRKNIIKLAQDPKLTDKQLVSLGNMLQDERDSQVFQDALKALYAFAMKTKTAN